MAKLVLWPARPLERVFKDSQPARVGEPLRLSCVRNEYEGCMFGLRSDADVKGVRLEVSELRSASGAAVPASCAKAFFVGSIPLSRNTPLTPPEELERAAPCEVPDPLLDAEEVARAVRGRGERQAGPRQGRVLRDLHGPRPGG